MTISSSQIGEFDMGLIDILEEGESSIGMDELSLRAGKCSDLATKALLASIDLNLLPEEWRKFILVTNPAVDVLTSEGGRMIIHCLVWDRQDDKWHPIGYCPIGFNTRFRLVRMRRKQNVDSG